MVDSQEVDVSLALDKVEDQEAWRRAVARKLRVAPARIASVSLLKKSIDARKAPVRFRLRLQVGIGAALPPLEPERPVFPKVSSPSRRVLIVGCGPAGMFAALRCLQLGLCPVIVERGKDVSARRFDLAPLLRQGRVIEDSNYCFGEGGAGTFSDGKLYTRATKRGPVRDIYETLVAHGVAAEILTDAHPHIGSNLLPNVVKALRQTILESGGEVHFGSRVSKLLLNGQGKRIAGVETADGREFQAEGVILATGHSARDIHQLLLTQGIALEQKPFAMGVRIEHPQPLIDSIQYHFDHGVERPQTLPAARYRLATTVEGRGVHSFCMCPGGFIVPCATENDELVVNGMSLSRRNSPYANSGIVVSIEPRDTEPWQAEHGVLAGTALQRSVEHAAKAAGGGGQVAPAQRLLDFLEGTLSQDLPGTSYFPGVRPAPLSDLLPDFISRRLREGLLRFGRSMPGYLNGEALLVGFETRSSSPVRIPRDPDRLEHPEVNGLFPCGEGAGYAGGIVSAALDGRRCAEAVAESLSAA
ncbi:MAG: FAD-binding protein [Verrucomicrobiaceae bacterium]|nr:FAD-binding protein [Verrucomicrobiaceae bacterium]